MDFLPFLCFAVFTIGLVAGIYMFISRSIQIVPEGNVAVIERSGEFRGVLNPGRHFMMPLDRIRALVECAAGRSRQTEGEVLHSDFS